MEQQTEILEAALLPQAKLIEALKRVIFAPHVRWQRDPDGRFVGTHIDDPPHSRMCTIIEWAEATKSKEMFALIHVGQEFQERYWKELIVFIPGVLSVLRAIETSSWVYANGGDKLHEALLSVVLENSLACAHI